MARLWEMQRDFPFPAFAVALEHDGGRTDVLAALTQDLPQLSPNARDLRDAPIEPALRHQFLARRAFARLALAHRLGCSAEDIEIARAGDGGPVLVAPDCGLHLSLSGRADFAAIAFGPAPVGVDIEPAGGAVSDLPLNVMHTAERAALAAAGADAPDLFLRLWCAKEAWLKALRLGFWREPTEIEMQLSRAGDGFAAIDRGAPAPLAASCLRHVSLRGRDFTLACAVLRQKP